MVAWWASQASSATGTLLTFARSISSQNERRRLPADAAETAQEPRLCQRSVESTCVTRFWIRRTEERLLRRALRNHRASGPASLKPKLLPEDFPWRPWILFSMVRELLTRWSYLQYRRTGEYVSCCLAPCIIRTPNCEATSRDHKSSSSVRYCFGTNWSLSSRNRVPSPPFLTSFSCQTS